MRANDVIAACAVLCVASCGKPAAPRANEPAVTGVATGSAASSDARATAAATFPSAPVAQVVRVFHPDEEPACAELATLTAEIRLWQSTASPQSHRRNAEALWPVLSPACRGGTFFLAAAQIVGHATDAELPTADGAAVVHSPADALAQGLAAEPDHPALLAHLAFADDLAPAQAPALPEDACARARARGGAWADYAHYVCALAAIHARDGSTSLAELESIRSVFPFPDLTARRAQALALAGKRENARALVKPAVAALSRAWRFDITDATIVALKKKLAAL